MNTTMNKLLRKIQLVEEKKKSRQPLAIDLDSKFVYTGGADVQKIWKKYGWTPPSEYRTDYLFKKNREKSDE